MEASLEVFFNGVRGQADKLFFLHFPFLSYFLQLLKLFLSHLVYIESVLLLQSL